MVLFLVFIDLEGKTGHRGWLWVFLGVDTVIFRLDPTRSHEVPEGHFTVPLESAAVVRAGADLTVLAYGTMVFVSAAAAAGGPGPGRSFACAITRSPRVRRARSCAAGRHAL